MSMRDGFVRPGRSAGLTDVVRRRYLLSLLVRKETRVRYRGSVLGWLWSYVRPLTQFIVFFLALGIFLQQNQRIENYAIYLFSGLIVINFFNEAFGNGTRSIVDNAHLIKKIYLPRELFPVSSSLVALVNLVPQIVVLLAVCVVVGWRPTLLELAYVLFGLIIVFTFAIGLSLLFGSINVPFRDAQNFVELIALVATWASPVLYDWQLAHEVLPEWLSVIYQLNPLTAAVQFFHVGFWYPTSSRAASFPDDLLLYGVIAFGISLTVLAVGQLVFRRLEGRFAQDL